MKLIYAPLKIKQVELKNRIVMPPMATSKTSHGSVTEALLSYYDEKSKGGHLGLIITEHAYINSQGMAHAGQMSVSSDDVVEGLSKIADVIHQNGTPVIAQISHAGRSTSSQITGYPTVSASAVPMVRKNGESSETPQAMTQAQINQVITDFVKAAKRVKAAGFDGVEIHSAHTYLLDQFYSPLSNKRTDDYTGQTLEGRLKLHKDVIEAVRQATGDDFLIALRLGGCDYTEGGATVEDSVIAAQMLESYGLDLLDISGGMNGYMIPGYTEPGYFSEMTQKIKEKINIPVILTGGVTAAEQAEDLLERQTADLIGVGRAIFKDSEWAKKELHK